MYLFDFKSKLQRLNPALYINLKQIRQIEGDWFSTGIYQRGAGGRKGRNSSAIGYASTEAQKLLRDSMAGLLDKYVGPCPVNYVPEYDRFEFDRFGDGRIIAIGWRTILMNLVRKKLIDPTQARKVFARYGLGESTYDKLTGSGKMHWAKENV